MYSLEFISEGYIIIWSLNKKKAVREQAMITVYNSSTPQIPLSACHGIT